MKLSDADRKILWTRAGNRCSYRFDSEHCERPLTREQGSADVVVGEECHIVGENPGSARYLDTFPERETYANAILLCGEHHTLIDNKMTRSSYPAEVLHTMKREHERSVQSGGPTTVIKDSEFAAVARNADTAAALDVAGPATLSNVRARLTVDNVRDATAARFRGPVVTMLATCEACGAFVPAVGVGALPTVLVCPKCGHRMERPGDPEGF